MINKDMLAANKEKCLERAAKLPEAPAAANETTCPVAWCLDMVKAAPCGCMRQERHVPGWPVAASADAGGHYERPVQF